MQRFFERDPYSETISNWGFSSRNIIEQALQGRAVQSPAGEATVVVALRQQLPTLMGLALDVGFTSLALGIQRIEVLLQARLGRFAGINGAALSFLSHGT
jgi:hypothetical protein